MYVNLVGDINIGFSRARSSFVSIWSLGAHLREHGVHCITWFREPAKLFGPLTK
jgi:hypothetical protein